MFLPKSSEAFPSGFQCFSIVLGGHVCVPIGPKLKHFNIVCVWSLAVAKIFQEFCKCFFVLFRKNTTIFTFKDYSYKHIV